MNILIYNENKRYNKILYQRIYEYNNQYSVRCTESLDMLNDFLDNEHYHLVFIDAKYSKKYNLKVKNYKKYNSLIVYICDKDDLINKLLDINVIGCIQSKKDIDYIDRWMNIVQEYYGLNAKMIDIGSYSLDINKIWAVESSGNYVIVYTENYEYKIRSSLKETWNKLKEYVFFARINRYYIVNLKIVEIDRNKVVTLDHHYTISPDYIEEVIRRKLEVQL